LALYDVVNYTQRLGYEALGIKITSFSVYHLFYLQALTLIEPLIAQ